MLYLPDNFQNDTITPQTASADNPADSASEKPKNRNIFYANAGYEFIVGKILLPEGSSGDPAQGFDFNIGYNYAINPIWSIGAIYSHYESSMHIPLGGGAHQRPHYPAIHRFGSVGGRDAGSLGLTRLPRLRIRPLCGKALGAKIGKGGFGSHFMFDAEYRFTPHAGIVANIAGFSGLFHSYLLSMEESKAASIIRCTLSAGIRILFKERYL